MITFYILDIHGEPKAASPEEWLQWLHTGERRVAETNIFGGHHISTVFLIVPCSEPGRPIPHLWETRWTTDSGDEMIERCGGSREQAEAMHASVQERAMKAAIKAAAENS